MNEKKIGAQNHIKNTWHMYKRINICVYITHIRRVRVFIRVTDATFVDAFFFLLSFATQYIVLYHVWSMDDISAPKLPMQLEPNLIVSQCLFQVKLHENRTNLNGFDNMPQTRFNVCIVVTSNVSPILGFSLKIIR